VGAEIILAPGEYIVGSDDTCDIIFSDQTVAPHHVQLVVTSTDIIAKPIQQPFFVAGTQVDHTSTPLIPLQIVTLGATHFSIGFTGADWSQLELPPLQTTTSSTAPAATHFNIGKGRHARFLKFYPWGGAGLLLCCMLVVIGQGNTKPIQPSSLISLTPVEQVQRLVNELNFQNLTVTALSNGRIQVQGYVKTVAQRQQLDNTLRSFAGKVEKRLWVSTHLVESANAIVRTLGLRELQITDGGPGTLIVAGYVKDKMIWQRALTILRRDIPSILRMEDQAVETLEKRRKILENMLAQHGLGEKLYLQRDGDQITVEGSLNTQQSQSFHRVAQIFRERYGSNPTLNTNIKQVRSQINLAIRSVSVGSVPYLVTQEGHKYMEGTKLVSGYEIRSIKPDKIILSLNGKETTHYLRSER
jgi:type III secretion system YscD/HrpQ family protein